VDQALANAAHRLTPVWVSISPVAKVVAEPAAQGLALQHSRQTPLVGMYSAIGNYFYFLTFNFNAFY
jgi:hypothetical protein